MPGGTAARMTRERGQRAYSDLHGTLPAREGTIALSRAGAAMGCEAEATVKARC